MRCSMASSKVRQQLGLEPAERRVLSSSMWPIIRTGDRIRFTRSPRRPRIGEVWVMERGELHVVHRVLWVSNQSILSKGDALGSVDGWVERPQLFGPVEAVQRGDGWWAINCLSGR